ncbi:zinc ribbon domain-containing protein [Legionella taurinensis]|uniref:FmdB family transcriptional regulator n=1 Tax=Legionella taurinensis TaxID=70611 RepID=A0A3A5LGF0_9GAMM|nr:zinc ribbon domain-containing protein [Legionella taurinensis]MDX1838309.1 zinc ribbon domain-containing protein [Legionella taurinensis]PUT39203.1 FmdB family transcriptional regulator [Legionella taurinensis]PUT39528.1 FmdB family transcriptional regulator [Legionella taurinensis]PUT43969.1 FmdB family transcriptional regulator [Legionella taurinensis]PUT45031.1 FmdB family transcriptional regulator [Legionella taurinensis]
MPIYEYECTNCHHHFDLMQKVSDTPAKQCPKCFENTAVRLVSAAGFQLKGSGWYVTDFKNKNKPEMKKTETGGSDASGQKKADSATGSSDTGSTKTKGESD